MRGIDKSIIFPWDGVHQLGPTFRPLQRPPTGSASASQFKNRDLPLLSTNTPRTVFQKVEIGFSPTLQIMHSIIQALTKCLGNRSNPKSTSEKAALLQVYDTNKAEKTPYISYNDAKAAEIVKILFTTSKRGAALSKELKDTISTTSWTSSLAEAIMNKLVVALEKGAPMAQTMTDAFLRAKTEAETFAEDHPVLTAVILTLVALAILALLFPWALEALGFAELGPVEGWFC